MISLFSRRATSASRSLPVGWSARVSHASPPNAETVSAIRSSSVATMTRGTPAADARRWTCSIRGLPAMSNSGLPGSLVEP